MPDPTDEVSVEELQKQLAEKDSELKKLKDKEMNFETLRGGLKKVQEMSDEEKKVWSSKEQVLLAELQDLRTKVDSRGEAEVQSALDGALNKMVGTDEKAREKALYHFNRIKDEATTPTQIEAKMREAVMLANGDQKDPLVVPISMSGNPVDTTPRKTDHADSKDGQDLLSKMGHESPKK